jgi:hypothetical protein
MATTLTSNTFSSTYKDDFKDSDNYHRILFNSGRALQARELTQMQSIIQSEIARFGKNLYNEGGVISAGGITINNKLEYIKLNTAASALPSNPQALVGVEYTVRAPDPQIKFRIVEVVEATNTDPATLYIQYTDTTAGTSGSDTIRVPNNAVITASGYTNLRVAASAATGTGTKVSVSAGDFFTQDHFVFAKGQSIFVDKYSSTPTENIGFKVTQEVVTEDDSEDLYDNQGASPNLASPGAHRLRIRLTLTNQSDLESTDNFVYLAKIFEGKIVDQATTDRAFNKVNDLLAIRTKEESGDYVVREFRARFNNLNDSNLTLEVSPGIAYVDGYRLDIPSSKITVPKARDTLAVTNEVISPSYGSYVLINSANNVGLPDPTTFTKLELKDATGFSGTLLGTCKLRHIEEDGPRIRFYIFDIQLTNTGNFRDIRSIGTSASEYANIELEDGIAQLYQTADNSLLFDLPNRNPYKDGLASTAITIRKRFTFNGVSGTSADVGGTVTDLTAWTISRTDGSIDDAVGVTLTSASNRTKFAWTGGNSAYTYEAIGYVTIANASSLSKTLQTNQTVTRSYADSALTDGDLTYLDIGVPDVYRVIAIKRTDSDGVDLSSNFIFDNGQRDNFYAKGRIIVKDGATIPNDDIFIKYDYFNVSGSGNFFDVSSYNENEISYENIPSYTKNNGETVSLRDVVDFRSRVGDSDFTGGTIFDLPQNTSTMIGNLSYYLPRKDRLVVSVDTSTQRGDIKGSLKVVNGTSSLNPQYPAIGTGALPLYNIELNPYTLNDSDVTTQFISNKRYTMKDIGRLERRIDGLEELTTLSLLELNTSTLSVLDSNGNSRTKSGFLVDNFKDFVFSDVTSVNYRASIDNAANVLTPIFHIDNSRFLLDSDTTRTNTAIRKGDLAVLEYTNTLFVEQNLASTTININPFNVIKEEGHMTLSPASDNWVETEWAADMLVNGPDRVNVVGTRTTNNRNQFRNQWFGDDGEQIVVGSDVIRELIGEKVIQVQVIPFMRSVKVYFKVEGLRPNTDHFPFFNGVAVDDWVREESEFYRFSSLDDVYHNQYRNATAHPDGSTALVSNANGIIYGSFFIPSTATIRFRTGSKIFKLLDISIDNEDAAISIAKATFTSTGVIETNQRTIRSTRIFDVENLEVRQIQRSDPLAQTFVVDPNENPSGIFATQVTAYFATKESTGNAPVYCEIRPVENGYPTSFPVPGATKFLYPSEVTAVDTTNITTIRNNGTTFTFDEPIYLAPNREYAVILKAESTAYNVYITNIGDFEIGSTQSRINTQPSLGSLFISQNGITWTADQNKDLMFKIFRADFETSGTVYLENAPAPRKLLSNNPIGTVTSDSDVIIFDEGHGFSVNDLVRITGLDSSDTYGGIQGNAINGTRKVTQVGWEGYKIAAQNGNTATSTVRVGGNSVVTSKQYMFTEFTPNIQTLTPSNTNISGSLNILGGTSFSDDDGTDNRNNETNSAYSTGSYETIELNEANFADEPKLIATSLNETEHNSGNKSATIKLDLTTSDTKVSPIVDLQRCSMTMVENLIDFPDSAATEATIGKSFPISYVSETSPTGGSIASKHLTKKITLEETAVGLKILFAANRPSEAAFDVYYRTAAGDEVLENKSFIQLDALSDMPSDENATVFREYEYLAGGNGGQLTPFSSFQVKIAMKTSNTAKIPTIKDLRVIALAT